MAVPFPRKWRRHWNELHSAARVGSIERTVAVLSRGVIDIDEGTPEAGSTPLMLAAGFGHSRIAGILLNKGANMSAVNDEGATALHVSAQEGRLDVTEFLVKAGADLEARTSTEGSTPLHLAARKEHSEVMELLLEAGASPNSRELNGATPLFIVATNGNLDATKALLRAKANPALIYSSPWGQTLFPLDAASHYGHFEVARELIQEHGIEGCCGARGGLHALQGAAESQWLEIMTLLISAGVVDTGIVLQHAVKLGRESSVKLLLQQWKRNTRGEGDSYLEMCDPSGRTAMLYSIQACHSSCSPRIMRMLVDAGADTATALRLVGPEGDVLVLDSLLDYLEPCLCDKIIDGEDATERQLCNLEAMRRLLLRVEAVHAVSWLWPSHVPSVTHAAVEGTVRATKATPTPLISMLPILRRRAGRPRTLLAALFRHSAKPY